MGSILALVGDPGDPSVSGRLERMIARSPHRGSPFRFLDAGLALGVQSLGWDASLSVNDNLVVAFHGFVGNWDELRIACPRNPDGSFCHAAGFARAYEAIPDVLFAVLRGEFAVVLFDRRRGLVLALRDVVGCRPLYYRETPRGIVLASEIRQVLAADDAAAELNDRGVVAHLAGLPPVGGETLFSNVHFVTPGSVHRLSGWRSEGRLTHGRRAYWTLGEHKTGEFKDEDAWIEELDLRTRRAVQRWLPDHPSSLTLSGGLDSSTVWAQVIELARRGFEPARSIRPISLSFPGFPCDETDLIERTLARTGHRVSAVDGTRETAVSLRPRLVEILDTIPFLTTYAVYVLAEFASACGRSTVLTGVMGDQWFDVRRGSTGWRYVRAAGPFVPGFFLRATYSRYQKLKSRGKSPSHWDAVGWVGRGWREFVEHRRVEAALEEGLARNPVGARLGAEQSGWVLQSWEQIGAACSVEFRHPFADPDLISLVDAMPDSLLSAGVTKPALRRLLATRLPSEVVQRRQATVFDHLASRVESRPSMMSMESPHEWRLVQRGLIDPSALDNLMTSIETGLEARRAYLWIEGAEAFARSFDR